MQSIQLTEEHKSKFLEMCKELFPEKDINYVFINKFFPDKGFLEFYDNDEWSQIHWFEFCITHLLYQIYPIWRQEDVNCITDFHLDIHNYYMSDYIENKEIHKNYEKYHPINYLYNKYKELQKLGYQF